MAKKVLVVDDEKLIVKGIRFSLLQDGMEVDCAYDGEEALNMAKANSYDMILLDVMLPKMDGFEVCQAIREFSDVPIVMLTAKGDDMDKILGLEYGADDYIIQTIPVPAYPEEDIKYHSALLPPDVLLQSLTFRQNCPLPPYHSLHLPKALSFFRYHSRVPPRCHLSPDTPLTD